MKLTDSVTVLPGVGEAVASKLQRAGLHTIEDCIYNLPRRYDDFSQITPIAQLKPGPVTIEARFTSVNGRYVRRGMHITEAVAQDQSGSVRIIWFNQPYRARSIKKDTLYYVSGEFGLRRQRFSILNPALELQQHFPTNTARIIPIYRESSQFKSHQVRRLIKASLPLIRSLPEIIPNWLVEEQQLMPHAQSLEEIHFPSSAEHLAEARRRYGFVEVFELTLAAVLNKQAHGRDHALVIPFDQSLAQSFVAALPFSLTDDQRRVIWQIYLDMQRQQPMNRLLEGDVGAGKTVVAAMAAIMAMKQGFQVALMAPTELLARQHASTIQSLLEPLGLATAVSLLVGSLSAKDKKQQQQRAANSEGHLIIGTHALLVDQVVLPQLGLVIVDEQHRFGVEQRQALQKKAGHMPHVLHMTATPIPRSLALTLYGELDISLLKAKPPGRQPIQTNLLAATARAKMYRDIEQQLKQGRQAFIVCPLIERSEQLAAPAAIDLQASLQRGPLKSWRIGLLHGKLAASEKEAVMQAFAAHELDVLVSTTVVEVGVDVPNASVMVIEGADRFGLAQIHQLRGRVGRSDKPGFCYLVLSPQAPPSRRLKALETIQDGFRLAELDLELRGPGAIYGNYQHGALDLRVATLSDTELIAAARQAAQRFVDAGEDLKQYPYLQARVSQLRLVTNLH